MLTVTVSGFASGERAAGHRRHHPVVVVTVVSDRALHLSVPAGARPGPATVTIDQAGSPITPSFSVTILTLVPPPVGEAGGTYSSALSVAGGTAPYTFSVSSGELAAGLFLGSRRTLVRSGEVRRHLELHPVGHRRRPPVRDVRPTADDAARSVGGDGDAGYDNDGDDLRLVVGGIGGNPALYVVDRSRRHPGRSRALLGVSVLSGRPGAVGQYSVTVKVTDALGSSATRRVPLAVGPAVAEEALVLSTSSGVAEEMSTESAAVATATGGSGIVATLSSADGTRRWLVSKRGAVTPIGTTPSLGAFSHARRSPVTAAGATPTGSGYLLVTASGHVYGFGSARSKGSLAAGHRGRAVGIVVANGGYWIVTSSGEVTGFGSLRSFGSVRPGRVRGHIVGIAASLDDKGYWLASSSGTVYAFGSARSAHLGSAAPSSSPVVAIAAAPIRSGLPSSFREAVRSVRYVDDVGSAVSFTPPGVLGGVSVVTGRVLRLSGNGRTCPTVPAETRATLGFALLGEFFSWVFDR